VGEILKGEASVRLGVKVWRDTSFWPVDKLVLAYFAFMAALMLLWWGSVPHAGLLLLWHIAGSVLLIYQIKRPNPTTWVFRNWYPVIYVASSYKEMADFLPLARHVLYDQQLADLDQRIWGVQPAVWLSRIQTPVFTEYLQWIYTSFVPAVILVAFLLWRRRQYADFQYYAFLIALGYLVSYLGYVLLPARGPRFLLKDLENMPLYGLWLFEGMQSTLDKLESVAYDAFPSGHTELTILAWWSSQAVSKRLFGAYFGYTLSIIFATVYLRYHYTVDVFAGAIVAVILIAAAPFLYRRLQRGV
jgi:membrane-associated phospholipid phosphatase